MISDDRPLVLGSASPRRRDLLADLRIPFVVRPVAVDEEAFPSEPPDVYLARITGRKLEAVLSHLANDGACGPAPGSAVLVADTIVVVDDAIVGKPDGIQSARATLTRLVGRVHVVMTRYAVTELGRAEPLLARTVQTEVAMRSASAEEIRRYAETGEGLDKAGAYAAQGVGAFLVQTITGSYTNVVGLPTCELVGDLQRAGLLDGFPRSPAPGPACSGFDTGPRSGG